METGMPAQPKQETLGMEDVFFEAANDLKKFRERYERTLRRGNAVSIYPVFDSITLFLRGMDKWTEEMNLEAGYPPEK
jgi:hypothetical protein